MANFERQSNLELLRIISMIMVVFHHANFPALGVPTLSDYYHEPLWVLLRTFSESSCLVCVNVFVLISGWFGIKYKIKGIYNIVFIAAFYLWFIAFLLIIYNSFFGVLNLKNLWQCAFPLMGSNWFILQYLLLYLIAPMLNNYINTINRKILWRFVIISFFINIYVGYVCHNNPFGNGYNFIFMATIYMFGRYLRIYHYDKIKKRSSSVYIIFYFGISLLLSLFVFIWYVYTSHEWPFLYAYNNPLVILSSVSLFCYFVNLKNIRSNIINRIAFSCLSVLLLHQHPLINKTFYDLIKYIYINFSHSIFVSSIFIIVICLFSLSYIMDLFRVKLQDFLYNRYLSNL